MWFTSDKFLQDGRRCSVSFQVQAYPPEIESEAGKDRALDTALRFSIFLSLHSFSWLSTEGTVLGRALEVEGGAERISRTTFRSTHQKVSGIGA